MADESPSGSSLETVARPRQARSRRTLERILRAAEELIEEKGLPDVSIPDIVARAGSSVGGFYGRFRDKNELLRALEERFFRQVDARLDALVDRARWHGAGLVEIVEAGVRELFVVARERRNLISAFVHRAVREPEFRTQSLRFREHTARRFRTLLLDHRAAVRHPHPERAVDLAVQLAFGLMLQRVVYGAGRAGGRELGDEELAAELTRALVGYLAGPAV